jgi:hypothetical protein
MSCQDGRDCQPTHNNVRKLEERIEILQKRLDGYDRMLRKQYQLLEALSFNHDGVFQADIEAWWKQHKEEDAKQKAAEWEKASAEAQAVGERASKMADYLRLKEELGL